MNAWLVWRAVVDSEGSWPSFEGLAEVVGVVFDEEEAHEVERTLSVQWARENAMLFDRFQFYAIDHELGRAAGTSVTELSDEEIMLCLRHEERRPFVIQATDLALLVDVDSLRGHEFVDVVRGLGDIVSTVNEDAGRALIESTTNQGRR